MLCCVSIGPHDSLQRLKQCTNAFFVKCDYLHGMTPEDTVCYASHLIDYAYRLLDMYPSLQSACIEGSGCEAQPASLNICAMRHDSSSQLRSTAEGNEA